MTLRSLLLATALLAATSAAASAQTRDDAIAAPVLRANVAVAGDLVRIGDVVENAGTSGKIAIYRAPELGTTGTLPTAQVLSVLRAHQVIGVDTRDLREISVTRLARTLLPGEIELAVAGALEHRYGFGDAANLSLTFERELASNGPGAAIAILEHGRLAFAYGAGTKGIHTTAPVCPSTLFRIGSMTKALTATAFLHLVDTGSTRSGSRRTR